MSKANRRDITNSHSFALKHFHIFFDNFSLEIADVKSSMWKRRRNLDGESDPDSMCDERLSSISSNLRRSLFTNLYRHGNFPSSLYGFSTFILLHFNFISYMRRCTFNIHITLQKIYYLWVILSLLIRLLLLAFLWFLRIRTFHSILIFQYYVEMKLWGCENRFFFHSQSSRRHLAEQKKCI